MAMSPGNANASGGRPHRRRGVMSEINVTPMVDIMLVLLIIFMISAPLLTVGVPIELPQSQAKSLDLEKGPLEIAVDRRGQVFLQNTEVGLDQLIPELQKVVAVRGDVNETIYFRGDRGVEYGVVMRVLGRLNGAGFSRVSLVTEFEQGA